MALDFQNSEPILLGAGELYLGVLPDGTNPETASETIIETALKNVGAIDSGCTLSIDKQMKDIKTANRGTVLRFPVETKVELKTGILTWKIDRLSELLGATVTSGTNDKKTVIGNNDIIPTVYLRFVHKKQDGGTLTVNIFKAQAEGKYDFVFDNEKPTTINYAFMGLCNVGGNYLEIVETFPEA